MRQLTLDPNITGQAPISLSGPTLYAETATGLRSLSWTYQLSTRALKNLTTKARETKLTIKALDRSALDRVSALADASNDSGVPMTLVMDGQWLARVLIPKTETTSVKPEIAVQSWTVILLDGGWIKYGPLVHYSVETSDDTGIDYPYDLAAYPGSHVAAQSLRVVGLPEGEFGDRRSFQLAALFTPADTTVQRVIWTSDQPGIATVTDTGLLTITGVAGSFDLNCQWAGDPGRVMDYRAMRVSYDSLGGGTITEMRDSHIFETGGWESTTHPDADDPTVLDIDFTAANGTGFVYDNNTIHLEEGRRYQVSYDVRLASGGAQGGRFDIVIWGPDLYAGHELRLKDLSSQWQHVSYTFTLPASYTQDTVHLVCNVYDKPTGSAAVRVGNLRIVALDAGGGQVNQPSLATLESLGYPTLENGVASIDSTDSNVELDSIHTVNLLGGHTYLICYDKKGSTLSVRLKQQFADLVGTGPKDDWYRVEGTITVAGSGVKAFNICLFVASHSHAQVRNLYMQDVAYVDTGVDHWAIPWDGLLYATDGVVRLSTREGDEMYQWTNKLPQATFTPGHTYRMSLETRMTGTAGAISTHLRSYWQAGVVCQPTQDWTMWTNEFTLPDSSSPVPAQDFCIYTGRQGAGDILLRRLRIEDLTFETGQRGG